MLDFYFFILGFN